MGRATPATSFGRPVTAISIHALRGEGDGAALLRHEGGLNISIHALRGEGDLVDNGHFLRSGISIHALRGEGDDRRRS